MSENPYEAPAAAQQADSTSGRITSSDIRAVAIYQKGVLFAILIYIPALLAHVILRDEHYVLTISGLAVVSLVALVFVVLLSAKVYNPVLAVLFGLLTLVGCLGLLILLMVNQRATQMLRRQGYRVGLLGVPLSDLD